MRAAFPDRLRMRRLAGQAGRGVAKVLHPILHMAIGAAFVATVAAGLLVWRLAQGPIHLDTLAPRLDARLNAELAPLRVHLDTVALAWEGWRDGLEQPVDLRVGGLSISDGDGRQLAQIPRAGVSLSYGWLLLGRIVPRAIDIEGAHLRLYRAADGAVSLGFGPAQAGPESAGDKPAVDLLAALARPPQSDRTGGHAAHPRWTQLRRVHIGDADLVMVDRRLGTVWHAPHADLVLRRHRGGGLTAKAALSLALAGQTLHLSAEASLPVAGGGPRITARFGPLQPAALAPLAPAAAPTLAGIRAALSGSVSAELGPDFGWRGGELRAQLGPGTIAVGEGAVPIRGAAVVVDASPGSARLGRLDLALAGRSGAGPTIRASGELARRSGRLVGHLDADVDQVRAADLGRYWPAGVARGAREWVTRNITAGVARSAHVALAVGADADGSHLVLTDAKARVNADGLTIHWLRPLPPVEGVKARLDLLSPDALVITTEGGRQVGGGRHGIVGRDGTIKITGLSAKDQVGDIELDLAGSVPDVLALLKQPRLHLLSKNPLGLRNPSGQVGATLSVALPLDADVGFDRIAVRASGKLAALHLGGVLGKADLDDAQLDLSVDNDGLQARGSGEIGGIPAELAAQMDFRAGPPTQVLRRYTVSAGTDTASLAALGLDPGGMLSGPLAVKASVVERRNGTGEADLSADLRDARVAVRPLGWRKPPGQPATATARVMLNRDRIARIDRIAVSGTDVALVGAVLYADGRPAAIRLDRAVLGATRAGGEIRLPNGPGDPMRLSLSGSSLDLSARLQPNAPAPPAKPAAPEPDAPWIAELRFGRVVLGKGRALANVVASLRSDGEVIRQARIDGQTPGGKAFVAAIAPERGAARRLTVQTADAGALLRAFGIVGTMEGGTLTLSADYDDRSAAHPLAGTAEIDSFRLRDAPAATRVLQGMTLYGAISALRGPGLGVSRLIAPFRLTGAVLELDDARAFSPSLGFTAHGWIDLGRSLADMRGTIVPAYFFNSLLGHVPLLGTLFSPEQGGGLFAATYAVRGRLDDPAVTVNPLAALTPGFLRGLFGVFGGDQQARSDTPR